MRQLAHLDAGALKQATWLLAHAEFAQARAGIVIGHCFAELRGGRLIGRHFNQEKQAATYDPDKLFTRKWGGLRPTQPDYITDAADWPENAPTGS